MEIKIYTLPNCRFCKMAKYFFNKYGLDYQELSLNKNPELQAVIFNQFGEVGVPLITIGNEAFVGFDKEGIKQVLNLS